MGKIRMSKVRMPKIRAAKVRLIEGCMFEIRITKLGADKGSVAEISVVGICAT
jgi:hypothetical protein